MNQKFQQKIYHANVNINLMEENVIQTKTGIMINVDVSVKNVMCIIKIIFGILQYIVVKIVSI